MEGIRATRATFISSTLFSLIKVQFMDIHILDVWYFKMNCSPGIDIIYIYLTTLKPNSRNQNEKKVLYFIVSFVA